jgi:hypothetical protein
MGDTYCQVSHTHCANKFATYRIAVSLSDYFNLIAQ